MGEVLIVIASAVRRYKSEQGLSLGTKLNQLQIKFTDLDQKKLLEEAIPDLKSITRAEVIGVVDALDLRLERLNTENFDIQIALSLTESDPGEGV